MRLWALRAVVVVFVSLLLGAVATAAPAGGWAVTLPDAGTYSYWVQSQAGSVSVLPATTSGKKAFTVTKAVGGGDTLYVLDAHSGQVATHRVVADAEGKPAPLTLTVADFKPLQPPMPAPVPAAAAPATPAPKPDGGGFGRIFTLIIGLIVAGGVFWILRLLVTTRGAPLLDLARRAGVPVADPTPMSDDAETAPVYTPPAPRPIEKIPEEAGAPPPPARVRAPRGPGLSLSDGPQLVGVQGIAAGSTFALNQPELTIGRDGDNGIVLAENTVSRVHARVTRDSSGRITIADEGSANGIYVNGTRVQRAILSAGDELKIGDNYFQFEG